MCFVYLYVKCRIAQQSNRRFVDSSSVNDSAASMICLRCYSKCNARIQVDILFIFCSLFFFFFFGEHCDGREAATISQVNFVPSQTHLPFIHAHLYFPILLVVHTQSMNRNRLSILLYKERLWHEALIYRRKLHGYTLSPPALHANITILFQSFTFFFLLLHLFVYSCTNVLCDDSAKFSPSTCVMLHFWTF